MTFANTNSKVSAEMVRTLCMALCVVMVLSFTMICNTKVAFCNGDPTQALSELGIKIADLIYIAILSLVTPLVILAFAIAGLQFFFGGNQGTEKAKKWIFGALAGFVLVVFAPQIGQFLGNSFAGYWSGSLSDYNSLLGGGATEPPSN